MASEGAKLMREMFNGKEFTKMYAEGAEKFTGWYAEQLVKVSLLDKVSDEKELVVLDQACGTGIVSKSLVDVLSNRQKANLELTCADFSDSMIDFVGPRIKTFGVKSTETVKADAMDTKLPSNKFTNIFLNFGPMIFTDGQAGFRELYRLLQPGGSLAMSTWLKPGWVDDIRAAFATDPEIPAFPTEEKFRALLNMGGVWDDAQWMKDSAAKAGFVEAHTEEVPRTSTLANVDEFSNLMAGMVGLIHQRTWSTEEQEQYKARSNELVIEYMKAKYGKGEIKWDWVAILFTAKKAA